MIPYIVELIGCTGAGKSTLAPEVIRHLVRSQVPALSDEQYLTAWSGLSLPRIRPRQARSLVVDVLMFPWFLRFAVRHPKLLLFMTRIVIRDVRSPLLTINVLRNVAKKMGIFELLRTDEQENGAVVFIDEGLIHHANSLFANPYIVHDARELTAYAEQVPLPDLIVRIDAPYADLLHVVMDRGNQSLPRDCGADLAARYLERNGQVFAEMTAVDRIRRRSITVMNSHHNLDAARVAASAILGPHTEQGDAV